ncbi:hypothetical protein [Paracoccus mutanolyticus]|uniref:hypothetical protein n=1 Tax=Paracoccus mutanolyticus TaxID=1499308 RepID=UPI0016776DD5|nr:hypothetical protein [Paracoccus mutanolyticus]
MAKTEVPHELAATFALPLLGSAHAVALGAPRIPRSGRLLAPDAQTVGRAAKRDDDPAAWDAEMAALIKLQDQIAMAPATSALAWAVKIVAADDGGVIGNTGDLGQMLVAQARELVEALA